MVQVLVLVGWMVVGLGVGAVVSRSDSPRTSWVPYALVLGPLWWSIAAEQRGSKRDPIDLRIRTTEHPEDESLMADTADTAR